MVRLDSGRQRDGDDAEPDRRGPEPLVTERLRPQQGFHARRNPEPVECRDRSWRLRRAERDFRERERDSFAIPARSGHRFLVGPSLQGVSQPAPQPFERGYQTRSQLGDQQLTIVSMTSVTSLVRQHHLEFVAVKCLDET